MLRLAKNDRNSRISCTWRQATATRAAFIEESRTKSIKADNFTGNPGYRHPPFARKQEPALRDSVREPNPPDFSCGGDDSGFRLERNALRAGSPRSRSNYFL